MLGKPEDGVPVLHTAAARKRRLLMPLLVLGAVALVALLLLGTCLLYTSPSPRD